ncbi:putative phosphoglycerate dehydrogenase [Helianthus anomalus]
MHFTPATSKILNDENFENMKKGVKIVNVARGGVIDEDALVRSLDAGIVAQELGSGGDSSANGITPHIMEREMKSMIIDGKDSKVAFYEFPYYLR